VTIGHGEDGLRLTLLAGIFLASCARPIPAAPPRDDSPGPLEALAKEVRRDLGTGFTIEPVGELYVVSSNCGRPEHESAKGTIHRADRALARIFFDKKPDRPIAIYLFRDKASYEDYCQRRYNEKPSTPYGFFRPDERKLVMNIATGSGTLVHEMVHPLLEADFPGVPSWLNEGLASLFEQCHIAPSGDSIRGLINWRLPGLQRAIEEGTLIALKDLLAMSSGEFYRRYSLPYAESRYLCLYLQEKGLLVKFYKAFRARAAAEDPAGRDATGAATLEAIAGKPLADLQAEWTAWVRTLKRAE
jgi:hypothetical protein